MKPAMLAGTFTIALLSLPAFAQSQRFENLRSVAVMDGRCEQLEIPKSNAPRKCSGKITNTQYSNGRSGFIFVVDDEAVLVFSGEDGPAEYGKSTVNVDKVFYTPVETATKPVAIPAEGLCAYTSIYAGPSHIGCFAATSGGVFQAEFTTDGKPPDELEF